MALITTVAGVSLPSRTRSVVEAILDRLGIQSAKCTSAGRDRVAQARVMLDNCLNIQEQFNVYKGPGDAVIRIVDDFVKANRAGLLSKMEAKIAEVGEENVSHHCLPPNSPIETTDWAQNSIAAVNHSKFIAACEADPNVSKILVENACFHIEVLKAVSS